MDNPGSEPPKPYTYLKETRSQDPNAPTAIFLDTTTVAVKIGPGKWLDHGEISRLGAEKSGYNTIALDINTTLSRSKQFYDYLPALKAIDADIHSGKLKVGKGDVLSISLAGPPTTFEQISGVVGKTITPANLAENKDLILKRLEDEANDPNATKQNREYSKSIVDTNAAIAQLQADGLTVIHAAGNDGQNSFQISFMNADVQLSSNKPDGTPDTFSESNSLTTRGDGVFPVLFHPGGDVLDPTPLERQKGSFEIVGSNIVVPNDGHESFLANVKVFDRQKFDGYLPSIPPSPVMLSAQDLLPDMHLSEESATSAWGGLEQLRPEPADYDPATESLLKAHGVAFPGPAPSASSEMLVVGSIQGTSFSNIRYLHSDFARLRQQKAEAFYGKLLDPKSFFINGKAGD